MSRLSFQRGMTTSVELCLLKSLLDLKYIKAQLKSHMLNRSLKLNETPFSVIRRLSSDWAVMSIAACGAQYFRYFHYTALMKQRLFDCHLLVGLDLSSSSGLAFMLPWLNSQWLLGVLPTSGWHKVSISG